MIVRAMPDITKTQVYAHNVLGESSKSRWVTRYAVIAKQENTRRRLVSRLNPLASCARQVNTAKLQDEEMTASYAQLGSTQANQEQTLQMFARTVPWT